MQAVDDFVVLNQTVGIEATYRHEGVAPERGERSGHEQQCFRAHPREARNERANILVGLKPLEQRTGSARTTGRREHAASCHQRSFGSKGVTNPSHGERLKSRVRIDGHDDIGARECDRRVECASLAARG